MAAEDFLSRLLSNPARAKILRVFIFGQNQSFTIAQAARRAGVSPRNAEREIRTLEELHILKRAKLSIKLANVSRRAVSAGNQKVKSWSTDLEFKHALPLSKFIHEISPVHYSAVVTGLRRGGKIAAVVLSGAFVGDSTRPADLIVAADAINETRLEMAIKALEREFGREIRYAAFTTPEFRYRMTIQDRLLRDTLDYPHLVLFDKTRLL
ncbi:MAG: hypothetical protein RLZZ416_286 [Candidatus Parcubacteria bacterium]|jgi:DNA-binding Lrp family transcriptional regulator